MMSATENQVFQPDLFCVQKPVFMPVAVAAESGALEVLRNFYTVTEKMVRRLEEPKPAPINSKIVIVHGQSEAFVLKGFELEKFLPLKLEQIEGRLRLVAELRREARLPFPEIIPSIRGRLAVEDGHSLYYLMRYENGGAYYPHKDEQDIDAVAACIGKLYEVLRPLSRKLDMPRRKYFESNEIRTFELLQRAASNGSLDPSAQSYWPVFRKQYEMAYKEFSKCGWSQKEPEICHIDLHPHNLLLRNSKVVGVLDFESILFGNRIACLGFSVFKLLRNYAVLTKASQAKVSQIREKFIEKLIRNKALDSGDVPLLSLGVRLENIKRFLYGFRNQNENKLRGGERMTIFGNALSGEIDFIFNQAAGS